MDVMDLIMGVCNTSHAGEGSKLGFNHTTPMPSCELELMLWAGFGKGQGTDMTPPQLVMRKEGATLEPGRAGSGVV